MNLNEKKSFIVYYDKRDMFNALVEENERGRSYDRLGRLFMALCDYAENGKTDIELDPLTNIAFLSVIPQLKNDAEKYKAMVNRNTINGRKGGRPRKTEQAQKTQKNPKNPSGYLEKNKNPKNPKKPKKADTVTDTDTDTDTVTDTVTDISREREKRKRFFPPTTEEIKKYCSEKSITNVDADRFIDHYSSNGWKVGANSMKDWKAAVRNWSRNAFSNGCQTSPSPSVDEVSDFFRQASV